MTFTPFKTHARNYAMNAAGSAGTYAKPVIIQGPDSDEPGVGLFRNNYLIAILGTLDAIRVADEIIDATENPVC